jgi:uncharacterized protein (TIGR04255 family)
VKSYPVFPNAPITEALLDIKVQLPQEIDLRPLESFYDFVKDRFPEKQTRSFFKGEVKISPDVKPPVLSSSSGIDGYLFRSSKENKVVQARLDGFTFNKLKPYENWELFRSEGHKLWELYSQIARPIKVVRIAVRYINRIEIPLPMKDFREYILTSPEIAPNLPQGLSHFFMRFEIPNPKIQARAIITQTMEPITKSQILPLILDIDVIKERAYVNGTAEMWDDFEKLRIFKNEIFLNSLTDKAKELFK